MMIIIMSTFFTSCITFEEVKLKQINDLKVEKIGFGALDLSVNAEIFNPNTFDITIKEAAFDIQFQEIDLGTTNLRKGFKINSKSTDNHRIFFTLDMSKINPTNLPKLMKLVSSGGNEVDVKVSGELKGKALLITKTFPVEIEEKLPFIQINGKD